MMTTTNPAQRPPSFEQSYQPYQRSYRQRCAQVPGTLAYLFLGVVLAWAGFSVVLSLTVTSASLLVIAVGVLLWGVTMVVASWFGAADRGLLELTGLPAIPAPRLRPAPPGAGPFRTALTPSTDPHRWTAWIHTLFVAPALATATFTIAISWVASALFSLTLGVWTSIWEFESGYRALIDLYGWQGSGAWWAELLIAGAVGLVLLATTPWVVTAMGDLHHLIARGMLGRWESDDAAEEAARAEAHRGAAVSAEDSALRRLERDLHDGPQQRLLRLQMDLAEIERAVEGDPARARTLALEARQHGHETLEELRALVGGMAPPLLQDRGLAVALEALVARSTVPVRAAIDISEDIAVPSEIERSAFFIVSELLTNVTKHSGATRAELSAVADPERLTLRVSDDGRGGARMVAGRGLHGLQERVRGLRGSWELDSVAGGPTRVTVVVPLR